MSIINLDGTPAVPNNDKPANDANMPPIGIAPDGSVVMTAPMWMAVQDRLRKCDVFVQTLATICRLRPDCTMKLDMAALTKTWEEGFGIDFHTEGQQMVFTAKKPIKLQEN